MGVGGGRRRGRKKEGKEKNERKLKNKHLAFFDVTLLLKTYLETTPLTMWEFLGIFISKMSKCFL